MIERFRAAVAVYGILVRDGRILLLRRAGSGYRDGELSLPAGHLDGGEDVVSGLARELKEELGIGIDPQNCRLELVLHRNAETPDDPEYIDFFFAVTEWPGEPVIGEPDKCTELLWARPDHLPGDVVDYITEALAAVRDGRRLALIGWP